MADTIAVLASSTTTEIADIYEQIHGDVIFSLETAIIVEEPRHSPDACFLCSRPLRRFFDIFMYGGDKPFCSEDCRQEQIDLDAAREREIRFRRRKQHRRAAVSEETPTAAEMNGLLPAIAAEAIAAG